MHWIAAIGMAVAPLGANPSWSIDDIVSRFDAIADQIMGPVSAHEQGHAQDPIQLRADRLEAWFEANPACDDFETQLESARSLFGPDARSALQQQRAALVSAVQSVDPPGSVFTAAQYRFPTATQEESAVWIARAHIDLLVRELGFRSRDPDSSIDPAARIAITMLACDVGAANSEALYQRTSLGGFPTPAQVGHEAVNAAILIAKHTVDPWHSNFIMMAAAHSAGAGELGPNQFGYLLDSWSITQTGEQLIGTYFRCEGGQAISYPGLIDPQASRFWSEAARLANNADYLDRTLEHTCATMDR